MTRPILLAVVHTDPGGVRELWYDLAEGLRARGHDPHLIALYPHSSEGPGALSEGWHFIVPRRPTGPLSLARLVWRLIAHLRHLRPASIITAGPAINAVMPLAAAIAGDANVIVTLHSPTATHNRLLDRAGGWAGTLRNVAAVVSVSAAVARTLDTKPKTYRAKRVTIHNALPERIDHLLAGMRRDRTTPGRHIVALGRLDPQKNHPQLIAAMASVPDATLTIVGEGGDRVLLEAQIASLDLTNRVHLPGHRPRAEALKIAANADIFAQVSRFEGHSLALIEAAKLGLPLVVSNVAEQVEAVTAIDGTVCAAIVPLDDPAALATTLMDMLTDSRIYAEWARLSAKLGQESSNSVMIDRYERLLDAPPGPVRGHPAAR